MAHDTYQFPESSLGDIRATLDAVQYAPEKQPEPYRVVKDIEEKIYTYRDALLAGQKKPKKWLSGLVYAPQDQVLHKLIDKESQLGGAMFGEGHRFWLDNKSSQTPYQSTVGDWFHAQPQPAGSKEPAVVLHFQTTPRSIYKLFNGHNYEPTIQELETFVKAVQAYMRAILPLYPIDQVLDELEEEIEREAVAGKEAKPEDYRLAA